MTASTPATPTTHTTAAAQATTTTPFTAAATDERLERVAAALKERNFDVEILDDASAARARVKDLIPAGSAVFTAASETLRLSGIDQDINAGGRYDSVKERGTAMDRATQMAEIWRMLACPDAVVGSVCAVTETGSLVAASASGSQLPAYAGAALRVVLVVGAQKVVPDLDTALRRVDEYCVPLEDERARQVYGVPSALNRLLVLNAEPRPGRVTVLLLREAIGF
ncbi:LUD domain-containing protein [Streptomyces aureus]|uniref:LUD domain-containing protein n=1 Tax=Streptomyces aureus TaxID=193461 RepID=UPI00099BC5CA|nr:LUD domain-containing protein [Streptomyces aureus]